jgi:hypothetical protein
VFFHITFKALPRAVTTYFKGTVNFLVHTNGVVISNLLNEKRINAAALSVTARVLEFSDDVFRQRIPGFCKFDLAYRTILDSIFAPAADAVAAVTHVYRWLQIFRANRTLQYPQPFFVEIR